MNNKLKEGIQNMNMQLASDITREINEAARVGVTHIRDYFNQPTTKDTDEARVDKAIKVASIGARLLATETNRAAVQVMMAKLMNLSGEALEPLWFSLTGTNAKAYANKPVPPTIEVKAQAGRPVGRPRKSLGPGAPRRSSRYSRQP